MQNYNAAIDDLDRVINLNPQDSNAYHNRGVVYADLGEYQRAIADYDEAIRLNPQSVFTYHSRGSSYR